MDTAEEVRANLLEMITDWDFTRGSVNDPIAAKMEAEKIYQLARIADALGKIEETGIYTYPQVGDVPQDDQE